MLVSSYIDSWMSNDLERFKENNSDIFTKQGELKADFKIAETVIEQIKEDPMFMKYITNGNQQIMTGEISGVPVKIKIDSFHPSKCITDLKSMASFDLIWNEHTHKKENFVDYYDYITQAAIYQEIVFQNTGDVLPFIIAACTKQKYSERVLLQIPQDKISFKLQFLQQYLPHIQELKEGKAIPTACGCCDYCISKKKCDKIYYYEDFWRKEE